MKTILYLYHTSVVGGGSYCLLNILKSIDRTKFRPIVLLKNNGPLVDEIEKMDIRVYFLQKLSTVPYNTSTLSPRKILNAYNIISSLASYKKILIELKPDLVYINTMMLYPYLRPARKMGIKTIIHVREHWPKNQHAIQRYIALKNIDKYATHIIGINSYSISMLDFSSKPKTIIYDWIDMSKRYESMPMSKIFGEPMDDKKVYLFMGGMQPIKGIRQVVDTFVHSIKDPKARLLIMGIHGNYKGSGLKGKIKFLINKVTLISYTDIVLKLIKSDKRIKCIPSMYNINDIVMQSYCLLSYFTIPHANLSLAEGIILGVPSIAADTPESREYSHNGSLAVLFPINNQEAFLKAIEKFSYNRDHIMDRIKNDSHIIKQMFDPSKNIQLLNNVYKQILNCD